MPSGWMPDAKHDLLMRPAFEPSNVEKAQRPVRVRHLSDKRPHLFHQNRRTRSRAA